MRVVKKTVAWYIVVISVLASFVISSIIGIASALVLLFSFFTFLAKTGLAPISVLNMEVAVSLIIIAGLAITGFGSWISSRFVWAPLRWAS